MARFLKFRGIVATLVVLGLLVVVVKPETILEAISGASLAPLAVGIALVQVQILLSAVRWRFTAGRLGQDLPQRFALREYYISSFLNQVLPGGVAGDAARVLRSKDKTLEKTWGPAAKAVVFERLSGQAALFLLGGCGFAGWLLISGKTLEVAPATILLVAGLCGGILGAVWIAFRLFGARLTLWWRGLQPDLARVFLSDHAWIVQSGLSLAIVGAYIAVFAATSAAVDAPLPLAATLTIVPLCLVTMVIPATIGGWGTREAAAAALWPIFGYTSGDGVAASILYGLVSLAGALPGLVLLIMSVLSRPSADA